jgi:NACHT domain
MVGRDGLLSGHNRCVTELVLVLCGAIIKTAFKLWAGNNALADEVSGDLTDMIKSRVSGALEQRKVRARFEKMEEIVADQLLALLNAEFRNLDDGEKNAAIFAVTETFNRARLTDKALFAANLDPLYLTNTVRKFTGDATRDLSWDGTALYDRILAQCCAYIIEIADKLPRFQVGAFAELLNRDDQIMARLTEVLERLPVPARDGGGADRVETAYRQLIAKRFDRLELFGLDFAAQWYALSIAYVNLSVSGAPAISTTDDRPFTDLADRLAERLGLGGSFEDWLARYPRLLIEGRAGAGKTTILQWIAVRAALRDFTGPAAGFNGYAPFFLRLREYADGVLPQPEQFLDKVASLLAPEAGTWPRERLRSGRALVLVDGVDEVPEAKRPAVVAWLQQLTELFPEVRYVVTTRPKALEDNVLTDMGFVQTNLEPMDPGLVRTFIERWHSAMREWQKDAESLTRLDTCRARLVNVLDNDRFLSELANTPLLAGLICALNHHLNAQLPRRRGDIFEKALSMFYERDRKRGIARNIALDLDATNHLLSDLALWMVRNAQVEVRADAAAGMVAADSARGLLHQSALSLPSRPPAAADLYGHMLLRSGVLREPIAGHVHFVHRTFQEYLAAKALIRTDNIGEIVAHANDDQWREVVILASGQGNVKQTTELLRGLMRPGWRGKGRYRRRLLAVACLDEIRSADPSVLTNVDQTIPDLLPPRDIDQAESLSHAGDRLIPYLMQMMATTRFRTFDQLIPVIRAATLIGGPSAFDLIKFVASNRRAIIEEEDPFYSFEINEEIERTWPYFDARRFAKEVIVPWNPERVSVYSHEMLEAIVGTESITDITLKQFVSDGVDLSALNSLPIVQLRIELSPVRDLSMITGGLPQVKGLEIANCPNVTNVSPIESITGLQSLWIAFCPKIDYKSIGRILSLEEICFQSQENLDLRIVAGLPNLRRISLVGMKMVDLGPLAGMSVEISFSNVDRAMYPATRAGHIYTGGKLPARVKSD